MEWIRITSRSNPAVKEAAALREKKYRDALGLFPAEGTTLLREATEAGLCPQAVFVSQEAEERLLPLVLPLEGKCRLYLLPSQVFEKVTVEKGSEGALSLFPMAAAKGRPDPAVGSFFLALENLQDPGNLGTILRSGAALGCSGVYLAGCADPFSPKAVRASMGALFRIPFQICRDGEEALALLENSGVESVAMALAKDAVPLEELAFPEKAAFWIGNEGRGLSRTVLSRARAAVIPMENMESLNAGVAAGIVLWEHRRRGGARK